METPTVEIVVDDLEETLTKLNFYPVYLALGIRPWNIHKKIRAKRVIRDTATGIWVETLLQKHPGQAEPTYYYAQISGRAKRAPKHLKNRAWHKKCRPDNDILAQSIIGKIGISRKVPQPEGYDAAEKKIKKYLDNLFKHVNEILTDIDLTGAEQRFREEAVAALRLKRID